MQSEKLMLVRADNPHIKSSVNVTQGDILGRGGEGVVTRVGVISDRAPERTVFLAHKRSHGDGYLMASCKQISENYQRVKAAQLPTFQTLRMVEGKQEYMMTDLTQGGQNVVLGVGDITLDKLKSLYESRSDQMNAFAKSESLTSDYTNARTRVFVDKAQDAELHLPRDTWVVVIKPDGSYDFVVADYGNVLTRREFTRYSRKILFMEDLEKRNLNSILSVQKQIGYVQSFGLEPDITASLLTY